jgi:hypothetical protein
MGVVRRREDIKIAMEESMMEIIPKSSKFPSRKPGLERRGKVR